jgi:hypothetical protein
MGMSNVYFADLQFNEAHVTPLQAPSFVGANSRLGEAEPFTLSLERFCLGNLPEGKKEKAAKQDIVVTSRHRFSGEKERTNVDKIHFMKDNFDATQVTRIGEFETIWATKDYRQDKFRSVQLHFHILDKDRLNSRTKTGLNKLFTAAVGAAGAVFPAFAPFAGITRDAANSIVKLIDESNGDDILYEATIELLANPDPGDGDSVLQPGHYVITDGIQLGKHKEYVLGQDLALQRRNGAEYALVTDLNYLVMSLVRRYVPFDDYAVDEAAATLLTELHRASESQQGANVMEHINDTFSFYEGFKKIDRYHGLAKKPQLSEAEKKLLETLKNDPQIASYLSQ